VLSLVAAALMPKQMRRVQSQLRRRPWASLGWGALAFFLAIPAIFIAVGITIVGLLLWLPFGLFVLLVYFFGVTAFAALLAQKALGGLGGKENLMLAVALGVVGTTLVSRVPVAGALALLVMTVMSTGAVVLSFAEHRRERREAEAERAAAAAAAAPAPYPAPGQAAPAAVITPIVQTSPAQQAPPVQQAPPAQQAPPVQQAPPAQQAPPVQQAPPAQQAPPQPMVPATPPQPPAGPEPPVTPEAPPGQAGPESTGEPQQQPGQPGQTT
jgi:hypothetical protein